MAAVQVAVVAEAFALAAEVHHLHHLPLPQVVEEAVGALLRLTYPIM